MKRAAGRQFPKNHTSNEGHSIVPQSQNPKSRHAMKIASSHQTVLHRAMEISDPTKRTAHLDTACGGDEELRQEVESVLATHDALGVKSACFAVRSHFGICARQAPLIAQVGNLFPEWEIIISKDGDWDNAKSIMGIMMMAANRGTQIEFFSLMPLEAWHTYIGLLSILCHGYADEHIPRQGELLKGTDPTLILEHLRSLATGYCERDHMLALLPKPDSPPSWSATEQSIAWHLFERHSYDVFLAATPDDFSQARELSSFLEKKGIRTYLCECPPDRECDSDFYEVTELAWNLTRHLMILGSSKAAFLSATIGHRCPCQYDRDWASRCPCDFLSIRLGDLQPQDLPGVLQSAPSFAWKDGVCSEVRKYVNSTPHQTLKETSGRNINGISISLGERRPHALGRDSTSAGDDPSWPFVAVILITILVVLVTLIGLGIWKACELAF